MKTAAERFEEIILEAMEKADKVQCPLETFAEGLEYMIEALQDRRQGVLEELSQ